MNSPSSYVTEYRKGRFEAQFRVLFGNTINVIKCWDEDRNHHQEL